MPRNYVTLRSVVFPIKNDKERDEAVREAKELSYIINLTEQQRRRYYALLHSIEVYECGHTNATTYRPELKELGVIV